MCKGLWLFVICKKSWNKLDATKTASKRVGQKTAEATGDLIGNKIADEITSVGKSENKEKKGEINEAEEIYIPP